MNELATEIAMARYGLKQRFQDLQNCVKKNDGDLFLLARDAYFEYVRNDLIFEKILGKDLESGVMLGRDLTSEERLNLDFGAVDEMKKDFDAIRKVHDVLIKGLDESLSFAGFSEEKTLGGRMSSEVVGEKEDEDANKKTGNPFLEIKNGEGYFRFNKQSKRIAIGGIDTRKFKLLQTFCEPFFGVHKNVESIFEAIKLKKDEKNQKLNSTSLRRAEILSIINWTKKEIRLKTKRIKFCSDNNDSIMWIELEG